MAGWDTPEIEDIGLDADPKTVPKPPVTDQRTKGPRRRLHSVNDVRKLQRQIFWECRDGKLPTNQAATQMQMLKSIADTIIDSQIEDDVAILSKLKK